MFSQGQQVSKEWEKFDHLRLALFCWFKGQRFPSKRLNLKDSEYTQFNPETGTHRFCQRCLLRNRLLVHQLLAQHGHPVLHRQRGMGIGCGRHMLLTMLATVAALAWLQRSARGCVAAVLLVANESARGRVRIGGRFVRAPALSGFAGSATHILQDGLAKA